jgi:hypothetical protein
MLRLASLALLATSACHASATLAQPEPAARLPEAQVPPSAREPRIQVPPAAPGAPQGEATGLLDLATLEANGWVGLLGFSSDYDSDPKFAGGVLVRAPSPLLSRGLFGMERDDLGIYVQAGAGSLDRDVDTTDDTRGAVLLGTLGVDYTLVRDESWLLLAQAGAQYIGITDVASADDGIGLALGALGGYALTDRLRLTFNPQFIVGDGDYLYLASLGLHFAF